MSDASTRLVPLRIVLAGFMGSGKTTVGRLLAARLGWQFIDLDSAVERSKGKTVPQIFAEDGEDFFRQAEAAALAELLQQPQTVIALGGGSPTALAVRDLLAGDGALVLFHLHAPFSVLYERCMAQARDPRATSRPLLSDLAAAERRYTHRVPIYASVCHITINVAESTAEGVVETILRKSEVSGQSSN